MIKKILQKGEAVLVNKCKSIDNIQAAKDVISDLKDTITDIKTTHSFLRGIGLAAPQIGKSVRVSVVENSQGKQYTLINPKIVERSRSKKPIREGCLSFFKYRAMVPRHERVEVEALGEDGELFTLEAKDDFAMLLQHEIDHLNGILYTQHLANGENDLFVSNSLN